MFARVSAMALLTIVVLSGCATLGGLSIQPPRFESASGQQAELRLVGPSLQNPLGGATIRLHARVSNPNPVGLTLARLAGQLALDGTHAAEVDFPLGLPLPAGGDTVIPLDITISFANIPALANVVRNAVGGDPISYDLNGTVGVDAGVLGTPTFGPMTLLQGSVRAFR